MDPETIQLVISLTDPELDAEEKDEEIENLLSQMRDLDEFEEISRVADPNPPAGSKSIAGFLVGVLKAEISVANLKKAIAFLSERLGNQPIEMKIKAADGREIQVKVSSMKDFDLVTEKAKELLNS